MIRREARLAFHLGDGRYAVRMIEEVVALDLISNLDYVPSSAPVRAFPGMGTQVLVWILGSSLNGAQLAE